jgi:DNA transformation protein and related proteins
MTQKLPRAWPSDGTVESLLNLGPMSSAVLRRCGILSSGQLRELGPSRAYVVVKREYGSAPRSLLWALEGALSGRPWREVAPEERLGLLLEAEAIERAEGACPASD